MRKILIILLLIFTQSSGLWGRSEHLLPKPQIIKQSGMAPFMLGRPVSVDKPDGLVITLLSEFLAESRCEVSDNAVARIAITLVDSIEGAFNHNLADFPDESYALDITPDGISIKAVDKVGVIRAIQTLRQLSEGQDGSIESVSIVDWSAFKLRGYTHDIGRSFIDFDTLLHQIDLLSRFKVNVFHWHLTENQAWRFGSELYPQLTADSTMTRYPGKFYTMEQCRRLEQYASERGMVVIPEIDMPGHSAAFERAMGHSMQTDEGVAELKVILGEVANAFPLAPYIHIGGDEKKITYPRFLKIMTDRVHELRKKAVAWNPIYGMTISADDGFDMLQLWSTAGRVVTGIPCIDCRYNYINHFDMFADLVGIYKSNIYYSERGTPDIAGFISAAWNDRNLLSQGDIMRQNNFYANLLASVERGWRGGGNNYIEQGGTCLIPGTTEFDEFADWESRFLYHKSGILSGEPISYVRQSNVIWHISDAFPNGGDAGAVFPPELSTADRLPKSFEYEDSIYGSSTVAGAAVYLRHTWGETIVPGFYESPRLNTTAYAWTHVYSPEEIYAGALIEFQNYSRSEKDIAPDSGNWDRKGSRIWLNNEELNAPTWANAGKEVTHELPLADENLAGRKPVKVKLRKGWNKVLLKLPYVKTDGVRLNKWMFTFVLTDTEGCNALDEIMYY